MRILAFVVTYNRLELLKLTIDSLRKQSLRIDEILVINNDSNDGTKEWLATQTDCIVINQSNVGGAGGFRRGVEYGFEMGFDWVWMMDDDVFPETNALSELMVYSGISDCLMPTRYYSDNIEITWGYFFDISKKRIAFRTVDDKDAEKNFYPINTGCFEGMLISRNLIGKIGYPDKRFFISGDDTIYGLLASKYTNLLLVKRAIMRKAQLSSEKKISYMYLYYMYRNFHLFEEYSRNHFNNRIGIYAKLSNVYSIFSRFFSILKINRTKAFPALKSMIMGYVHSIRKFEGSTH